MTAAHGTRAAYNHGCDCYHCQLAAGIDPTAVDRTLHGERLPLTRADRAEVTRRAAANGATAHTLAQLLNTNGHTARRALNRHEATP